MSPGSKAMGSRTYQVGPSSITLAFDNILKSSAQVLVSSDDYMLSMGGGVSGALRSGAGGGVAAEAAKATPAKAGDVIVTSGGRLRARYIFHAVTIGPRRLDLDAAAIVRQATQKAIEMLPLLGCRSIAFPAIGTGAAGIASEIAAAEMASALLGSLLESRVPLQVELYLGRAGSDSEKFFALFESHAAAKLGLLASKASAGLALKSPADGRRRQVVTMLRHLDARRGALEARLLPALTADSETDAPVLGDLRAQLRELQELRRGYEAELAADGRAAAPSGSVFLSSTSMDLQPHRAAVRKVIDALGLKFVGMEDFAASGQAPATLIRKKVDEASHYLGIIGMRYGHVDPGSGLSMTELEYRQAVSSAKQVLLFVMDKDAPITAGMVETDPQSYAKLVEFRGRILKEHTCGLFTGPADLAGKAELALNGLKG
jgi:O-acetyl-ADP-ribose deacetylase (regulator of RNase III)